jgi:hypothetical protein
MISALSNLNRYQRREVMRYLKEESAKWPVALKELPREQWPNPLAKILRVLRSRDYLVQVYAAAEPAIVRLSVNRTGIDQGSGWLQDISWEDLQRLKREAGYANHDAVEVFPPDCDVVNVANMRHLWVLPPGNLPFAWRSAT